MLLSEERGHLISSHRQHVFVCTAQRKEIAPALVLNFLLLFESGALNQITDVVLQSKMRPLLVEVPYLCACIS